MKIGSEKASTIANILDMVKENGIYDLDMKPLSFESCTGVSLWHLPLENLKRLEHCDIRSCSLLNSVLQKWEQSGALHFEPYIQPCEDNNDFPILVLSRDDVLSFRQGGFVLSHKDDGLGFLHCCSANMDFLHSADLYLKESKVGYMLWWACLLDAGCVSEAFRSAFLGGSDVIEEFMHITLEYAGWHTDYTLSSVIDNIQNTSGNIDGKMDTVYQLWDNGDVKCRFKSIGSSIIAETAGDQLYILTVPDCCEGITSKLNSYKLTQYTDVLRSKKYCNHLLQLLLFFAGIRLDYIRWEELKPLHAIHPLNSPYAITVNTLKDLL